MSDRPGPPSRFPSDRAGLAPRGFGDEACHLGGIVDQQVTQGIHAGSRESRRAVVRMDDLQHVHRMVRGLIVCAAPVVGTHPRQGVPPQGEEETNDDEPSCHLSFNARRRAGRFTPHEQGAHERTDASR